MVLTSVTFGNLAAPFLATRLRVTIKASVNLDLFHPCKSLRVIALVGVWGILPAGAQQPAPASPALLKQYCLACHNQKLKTAGVSVQALDPLNVAGDAATWEKVVRKVSTGQMPPPGMPHPSPAVSSSFASSITDALDRDAEAHPNPGRPTIHRLNRAEYSNAIRDLLALDIKPGAKLPADDTGYGFDNIGDVLSMSPMLVERYLAVARTVSRLAVGDATRKPEVNEFTMPRTGGGRPARSERASDDLPFNSAGGMSFDYQFPVDAEYVFRMKVPVGQGEFKTIEERVPVKAGNRTVGVTFLGDNAVPEIVPAFGFGNAAAANAGGQGQGPGIGAKLDLRLDGARVKLFDVASSRLTSVAIAGPYNIVGVGESASRQKIFTCKPSARCEGRCLRLEDSLNARPSSLSPSRRLR